MSSTNVASAKSPLDAAQNIVAELTGMTAEHQTLALKFATETLGLKLATASLPASEPQAPSPQDSVSRAGFGADHSTDIRSFTAMKAPKTDQQFTAVVAYFYQFEAKIGERKDSIDAETMKEAARLAGRAQVARWNMTLTNAKNAGYLDTAGTGQFKLSSVGENLVAITLPGDGGTGQSRGNGVGKKSKKKVSKKVGKKRG